LFELICSRFEKERSTFNHYIKNTTELEDALKLGANKARNVATPILTKIRKQLGY